MPTWNRADVLVNGRTPLAVYTSPRSGLRFAIADVPGPMVKTCIALGTEANSDDGLPHTLEHLVFMGSEQHPYKGFLDVIANRCFASGTNAWTSQDHTAYTLHTVGAEGFYKSFPVYLDHILRPTLSRSQYATEVHHVNEKGEDAGVVYCEMQNHESGMYRILHHRMGQLLHPAGHGYASVTGGTLEAIRTLCSVERVRNFHSKFYHIGNVFAIICGKVDCARVQKIMEDLETTESSRVPSGFRAPFSTVVPALSQSIVETLECPSDDPSHGGVIVAWHGPHSSDRRTVKALDILFNYLTETAVSPLQQAFVNIPEPLASSVRFDLDEQTVSALQLFFGSVPAARLEQILPVLTKALQQHQNAGAFDATRMGFVCKQAALKAHARLETRPSKIIFRSLINHQLYGHGDPEDIKQRMNDACIIEQLGKEPMQFWAGLAARYFSAPSVTLLGKPSKEHAEKLAAREAARVAAQCERLGKDGLERCKTEQCKAVAENAERQPPKELLDQLMVNNFNGFDNFNINVYRSEYADLAPPSARALLDSFPFPATVHHTSDTRFVELRLSMDTTNIDRRLLYVFTKLPFESAAVINGVEKSPKEVCSMFTHDLLAYELETGYSSCYHRALVLWLKVDADRYSNVARWAQIFLKGMHIDAEKIKNVATRLAGEARQNKRDGNDVCRTLLDSINYKDGANAYLTNAIVMEKIHEELAAEAVRNPQAVVDRFEKLRSTLISNGFNAHILCDADAVMKGKQPPARDQWVFAARSDVHPGKRFEYTPGEETKCFNAGTIPCQKLVALASCESSFLKQSATFPVTWEDARKVARVMLLTQYLSQCEGPLWTAVRGAGLAYGVWIRLSVPLQNINLTIYRSANLPEAYAKVEQIVRAELTGGTLNETQFEAAKRSLICDLYTQESTVSAAGARSVLNAISNKDERFLRTFTQSIWECDAAKVLADGSGYILAIFEKYRRAVCAHTRQVEAVQKAFGMSYFENVDALALKP